MGKTFRRDSSFRPKKQGRVFSKDKPWKKKVKPWDKNRGITSADITQENFGS